jgi:asparagine synthase (glutamine-hydrolysing)
VSGIAAIVHIDGAPVEEHVLDRVNDAGRHRGPDGSGRVVMRHAGLAYRHLETGNCNTSSRQPMRLHDNWIVLDGRVDNRKELRSLLRQAGAMDTHTDAEIILLAYEQWGTSCVDRMAGEFAFAIWDNQQAALFCARDALGVKPFHYYHRGNLLICASEIRQLLEHPQVLTQPNEGMIAEYACFRITSRNETLYKDVFRLPPGHFLVAKHTGIAINRYWKFRSPTWPKKRTDAEYAEEYLDIFREAVRCRIEDSCNIGFDLSGGLDSSAIVCTADRLTDDVNRFRALSLSFTDVNADERAYFNDAAASTRIRAEMVPSRPVHHSRVEEVVKTYRDFPGAPNILMLDPVMELFRETGCRVHLGGLGGDNWLTGDVHHTADLVRRFRWWSAIRQARSDRKAFAEEPALKAFVRYGIFPLMPPGLLHVAKRMLKKETVPPWIEPNFSKAIDLASRLHARDSNGARSRSTSVVQANLWNVANSAWWALLLELIERYASSFGHEIRHPFFDRRLVEFCLSLPEDQRWRGEETKFIHRAAMKGILPESIRTRRTKAEFSAVAIDQLMTTEAAVMIDSSLLISRGYVRRDRLLGMYTQFKSDYNNGVHPRFIWPLTMMYGLDSWLRFTFN